MAWRKQKYVGILRLLGDLDSSSEKNDSEDSISSSIIEDLFIVFTKEGGCFGNDDEIF